jgi:hypothetical protein
LKGKTPYEFICQRWTIEPERFKINPHHHSGTNRSYSAHVRDSLADVAQVIDLA